MLELHITPSEEWDELREEFVYHKPTTLRLEHSLLSVSKWESKWHKPFLEKQERTEEELFDYIRCMCITPVSDESVLRCLDAESKKAIVDYINDSHTATTFKKMKQQGHSREMVTSELIYYWMVALNIPMECEKWHLNRLLTLVEVCNVKNAPPKKMGKKELYSRNRAINEANKKKFHTRG